MNRSALWRSAIFLFAGAAILFAEMTPETPVLNFRLPMFSDEGVPLWDLRGQEGRYIDENRVDVFGMIMAIFSEANPSQVEARIHSPSAIVHIRDNHAQGEETITMEGDHYTISGKKWHWEGNDNRVTIDEDAQVFFYEDITGLFR